MKARIVLRVLLAALFIFNFPPSPLWAADSDVKELKKEVQELKETVEKLSTLIETQNKRIADLEEIKIPSPPQRGEGVPSGETISPSFSEKPETQTVQAGPAESTPPRTTRSYGFWDVPINPQGPSRFLPDISVNGIFAGAYFTQDPEGDVGHDPSRTGFNLQEIELAIQSVIDPYVRADIYLAFSEDGVEVEEAYVTTLSLPRGLQLKGGKFLLPFGRQNPKHVEQWAFVDNNLVNQRLLGPEGFNELGIQISYLFPTPFFFLAQGNFTQGSSEDNFDGDRKQDFAYSGRLSGSGNLTNNITVLMGASAAFGFNNTGSGNATNLYGGDFLLSWRPSVKEGIDWQTEYIYRRRQVPFGLESVGGLYSYLVGNWSKRWGAGFRVDYMGIPKDVQTTLRLSPMVVFKPSEFFQVRAQYELIDDNIMGIQQAAFLQWIFTMGPHGPHPF